MGVGDLALRGAQLETGTGRGRTDFPEIYV